MKESIKNQVEFLPSKPGVYLFLDIQGTIIYVGKAKNLKKRVSSYFSRNKFDSAKLRNLVSKVISINHFVVDTESDALLLENNLIKKHKPKYNILLKDDKTYPWICIKNEPFPRVFSTRKIINDGSKYFGPYTSGYILKTILELIKSIYPIRTCNLYLTKSNIASGKFKPCLEFQLGNCLAPCINNQSTIDYDNNIKEIVNILKGNIQEVKRLIVDSMSEFALLHKFEEAHAYKLRLEALERFQAKSTIVNPKYKDLDVFSIIDDELFASVNYIKIIDGSIVQSHNLELKKNLNESREELLGFAIAELRIRFSSQAKEIIVPFLPDFLIEQCKYSIPSRGDKLKLLELSSRNAKNFVLERKRNQEKQNPQTSVDRKLQALQRDFRTKHLPKHIECFDNSNLQGTNPVAACVVFRNAKPSKREYRHFNVKTVIGANDYASMEEIVHRRYSRMLSENQPLPQLVVIDGGKGQLSAACSAIEKLGLLSQVQVIGIAKRLEEIFFPNDPIPLFLDKNSESLRIIQNIRNEAHRFGLAFHKQKRSTSMVSSVFNSIDGIGDKSQTILIKHFKSIEAIKSSSLEELQKLVGNKRAQLVFNYLNSI